MFAADAASAKCSTWATSAADRASASRWARVSVRRAGVRASEPAVVSAAMSRFFRSGQGGHRRRQRSRRSALGNPKNAIVRVRQSGAIGLIITPDLPARRTPPREIPRVANRSCHNRRGSAIMAQRKQALGDNAAMADDTPFDDADTADERLRPPWEDTPDETDADRHPWRRQPPAAGDGDWRADADLPVLLTALADASDALARLDARVATAADAIRDGLLARLALTEAAGFLAHSHVWVHPLDLALREAGLTAPAALAALGAGARALPHTIAQPAGRLGWEDPPLDTLPAADQGIADALAFARLLRRLPGGGPHPFGSAAATAETLTALGARRLDPGRLAAWWDAHAPASPPRRRFGARRGEGRAPRPPLLAGAVAARAWMESGIIEPGGPGAGAARRLRPAGPAGAGAPRVRAALERLPGGRLRRPRCTADAALGRHRPDRRLGRDGDLAGRLPAPRRRERAPGAA